MKNICILSTNYTFCMIIQNYYYSILNIFPNDNVFVYDGNISTLDKVDILFILDEHWMHEHWNYPMFIQKLNDNNIKVVVLNVERVWNGHFPWNEDYQRNLEKIKNLNQIFTDVDDAAKYNHKNLNKFYISKYFDGKFNLSETKKDKIVFIGSYKEGYYTERKKVIDKISSILDLDIFEREQGGGLGLKPQSRPIESYLNLMSQYRFVLNPISTSNSIAPRFCEILFVKSIPIQQITRNSNMERYYEEEFSFQDCIFFEDPEELPEKIKNFQFEKSNHEIWYEDYLLKILEME